MHGDTSVDQAGNGGLCVDRIPTEPVCGAHAYGVANVDELE
jgi:hypothetical protein